MNEQRQRTRRTKTKNAVDKALSLLFVLSELSQDGPVRISELVARSGFTRPTVHRYLNSLLEYRLVERAERDRGFRLGTAIIALSASVRGSLSPRERALPHLRALADEMQCTVHLGMRDGDRVIYVEKIESQLPIRLASAVGQAAGMHCSGLGKAILAFSEADFIERYVRAGLERRTANTITTEKALYEEIARIRAQGFAVDNEENEVGVRCVSAPVFNHDHQVVASLSVSGTAQQIPRKAVASVAQTVLRYAHQISKDLGYEPSPPLHARQR